MAIVYDREDFIDVRKVDWGLSIDKMLELLLEVGSFSWEFNRSVFKGRLLLKDRKGCYDNIIIEGAGVTLDRCIENIFQTTVKLFISEWEEVW